MERLSGGLYSLTLPRLAPMDEAAVYCVGDGIGTIKVKVVGKEDLGSDVGSNEFQFSRGRSVDATEFGSGFNDFLYVLLAIIVAVLAIIIVSILFGLTGKLYRRWKLFDYKDK